MATDLFNNPSNDYVYPALSPCAGVGDDSYLEFLPNKSVGITQGGNILTAISFGSIKIPVSAYSSQKKVLDPQEVTFIAGLTKGLDNRKQVFILPGFDPNDLNPYFMEIDLSVSFYKNFKYSSFNVRASGDYGTSISIETALNLALNNIAAKIESTYDPSALSFVGTQEGYNFEISNVILTLIDTSENALSPFRNDGAVQSWILEEDLTQNTPYAKYPNSALQGIIMKCNFPSERNTAITDYDKWFYVNHLTDVVSVYDPVEIDNYITNLQKEIIVTFDPSIKFGPFTGGISPDFVDDTIVSLDLANMFVENCFISDTSLLDSSILGGTINMSSHLNGTVIESAFTNAYILQVDSSTSIYVIEDPLLPESQLENRVTIELSKINDCSIHNALVKDTSVFNSFLLDVSLQGCTLYNCTWDASTVTFENCLDIRINQTVDANITFDTESSIYYSKNIKSIDVGRNGSSSSTVMSAGDYLAWVTENNFWKKVGDLYFWTTAPDFTDTKNLINGFYVYNPHNFPIQLEYLLFV